MILRDPQFQQYITDYIDGNLNKFSQLHRDREWLARQLKTMEKEK